MSSAKPNFSPLRSDWPIIFSLNKILGAANGGLMELCSILHSALFVNLFIHLMKKVPYGDFNVFSFPQ